MINTPLWASFALTAKQLADQQAEEDRRVTQEELRQKKEEQDRESGAILTRILRSFIGDEGVAQLLGDKEAVALIPRIESDQHVFSYARPQYGTNNAITLIRKYAPEAKEWLTQKYINEQLTVSKITSAAELGKAYERLENNYMRILKESAQNKANAERRAIEREEESKRRESERIQREKEDAEREAEKERVRAEQTANPPAETPKPQLDFASETTASFLEFIAKTIRDGGKLDMNEEMVWSVAKFVAHKSEYEY